MFFSNQQNLKVIDPVPINVDSPHIRRKEQFRKNRSNSDVSQFDTPQDQSHDEKFQTSVHDIPANSGEQEERESVDKKQNENPTKSEDDDDDFNFNNELIVLVQHQGSDDEVVIGVNDSKSDDDNSEKSDININDEDEDLIDETPFARNGSITTVGVVSEGSMAFNSVSANQSVSSLLSSDDNDEEKGKQQRTVSLLTDI